MPVQEPSFVMIGGRRKDLWTPLNRLYWPDEQPNNRARKDHK